MSSHKVSDYSSIGGLVTQSRYGDAVARKARAGFYARFEREVDPDGTLAPEERERRAKAALRAHMKRLAMKSKAARVANKRMGGSHSKSE